MMPQRCFRFGSPFPRRRARRGLTFIEMMVAVGIFSTISVAVAWITLVSARLSRDSIRMIQSEENALLAAELIRKETLVGEFLSVVVTNSNHTVQFFDPIRGTTTEFAYANGALTYRQNTAVAQPTRILRGLSDVRFFLEDNSVYLRFEVTAPATTAYNVSRPVTIGDRILMRNLPQ